MRLLVSVRGGPEAATALAGGAEIIDAKEPSRGPLGRVGAEEFRAIAARIPPPVPLSAALGDVTTAHDIRDALAAVVIPDRHGPVYLKLGFAGVRSGREVTVLLDVARESAAAAPRAPALVAVAYADHEIAGSPPPEEVLRSAREGGARAFLVDTWTKDGRGLLDHLGPSSLAALSETARGAGLLFAVAGSLDSAAIERVAGMADVIGVRGAACRGGRGGTVDQGRVRELRRCLDELGAAGRPRAERPLP